MKILVISGFLGSGKTTFIRELVKHVDARIAILENEYAQAGVDGRRLESSLPAGRANIWELTEGCICCSKKADFAASALTIANTSDPEYLVVEPTGVGILSSIITSLKQIEYERISLLAPIAIVDGRNYGHYLNEYPELFRDQIKAAHMLVVSKMEHADSRELARVKEVLSQLNPHAELMLQHYSQCTPAWWQSIFERSYDGRLCTEPVPKAGKLPDTCSFTDVFLNRPEELIMLLENLIRGKFGDIFRAKGYIRAGKEVLRFDVADGLYAITGEENAVRSSGEVVFIGNNLNGTALSGQFCGENIIRSRRKKIRMEAGRAAKGFLDPVLGQDFLERS